MTGRILALALFAIAASPLFGQPPNVFIFSVDSCRADRFGLHGNSTSPTPNIDAWATGGTVFDNAYSVSAWTAPGLVSILTGLYPTTHGVNNRDRMGSPDMNSMPKLFRRKGYAVPSLNFFTFAPYFANLGLGPVERRYFGSESGDELINWLDQHDAEKPFFLWYHCTIVHQPYDPGDRRLPAPRKELMKRPGIKAAMTGAIVPKGSTSFQADDEPILMKLYDAEMSRMDELFQKSLELLAKKGLTERTLVVFTADHAEELLDHGFVGHASTALHAQLYQEIVHIPLIFSWPGKVAAGKRVSETVTQVDILPTVLELLDLSAPAYLQGIDLMQPSLPNRSVYFESVIAGNQTSKEREHIWVNAILKGKYKYISRGELYDLEADPKEKTNILEQHPEKAQELQRELEGWLDGKRREASAIFSRAAQKHASSKEGACPAIYTPGPGQVLEFDLHTGAILFDWSGSLETAYMIEYDIGEGDHKMAGKYEVKGNHHLFGPFTKEYWQTLKAWNPIRFRVSPKRESPCWSEWREFSF